MRKRWVVLLTLIAVLTLGAACGGEAATPEGTPVEATPPAGESDEGAGEVPEGGQAETADLHLVDSAVCEQFDPPTPAPVTPEPGSLAEVRPDDWIRGPEDATVTILLYNDFQ